ncbi:hypothetical protein D3C76_937300 [compost metagenome]
MLVGIGLQFSPRDVEQWPQQMALAQRALTRHTRQPAHAGPTQHTEQQGFRLIVAVLGGQQDLIGQYHFGERVITRVPRRTLQTGTGLHLHLNDLQRDAQRSAHRTTMFRPRIGHSLKAVMNMDGAQRRQGFGFCEMCKEVQQDGGVQAAGEGDVPSRSVTPRFQIQQKPGRQVNRGPIHISPFAQIKCGSGLAREGG